MKTVEARNILETLLSLKPRRTAEAPKKARGIYGLIDHFGDLRYIGSTSSRDQTLYERIYQRHRTGSEGMSHYFSSMYNVGRMWRNRKDATTATDGQIAKTLPNAFVAQHCAAVWLDLPDDHDIAGIEQEILRLAPQSAIAWNSRKSTPYEEPVDLVDATIKTVRWGQKERDAVERQRERFLAAQVPTRPSVTAAKLAGFPVGSFRFVSLDVETANNGRASICQIGLAGVRADNTIHVWSTYINPKTDDWSCSRIHGITARHVVGAPAFEELLPMLDTLLAGGTVYQHSTFDASAVSAACRRSGLEVPGWNWKDSLELARGAWPELKGVAGHGLASLQQYLGLQFTHHDAGEDARACAEVVLRAEEELRLRARVVTGNTLPSKSMEQPRPMIAAAEQIDVKEPKIGSGFLASPKSPKATSGTTISTCARSSKNFRPTRLADRTLRVLIDGRSLFTGEIRRLYSPTWMGRRGFFESADGSGNLSSTTTSSQETGSRLPRSSLTNIGSSYCADSNGLWRK